MLKYFSFHEQTGHDTLYCWHLTQQIEELIRNGNLIGWVVREVKNLNKDYKKFPPPQSHEQDKELADTEMTTHVKSVRVIIDGPHVGGDTGNVMERYAWRPIILLLCTNIHNISKSPPKLLEGEFNDTMFIEKDGRRVHHPHIDARVVMVKFAPRPSIGFQLTMEVLPTFFLMTPTPKSVFLIMVWKQPSINNMDFMEQESR